MKSKIGIFTCNSFSKTHPRIQMQMDILLSEGFTVELVKSPWSKEGVFFELINLIYFKYFKWRSIFYFSKKLSQFDVIHIYDFQLLPLAKRARRKNKKVIYETLDDNVHLHFYAMQSKVSLFKFFKQIIIKQFSYYELQSADKYCSAVIVNSENLQLNFKKSELIYYASGLESVKTNPFNKNKETVFLYLGKLTEEKGAGIYLDLLNKFKLRMFFLGKAMDVFSKNLVNEKGVEYLGEFTTENLKTQLLEIINDYNVIGLSIILPINKSYELQEANKDIDYLAMSMPFIGNDRKPTLDKIKDGAGVLFSNEKEIFELIGNQKLKYDDCRESAKRLSEKYSSKKFRERLLRIYTQL